MIELHPEKKMPLYEQLYNALAQDIRSGALQPGKALPGRRTMAAQLGISTNTVDTAYQMLAAEGLAVTRPRSGFFVQETGGMLHTRPQHSVVPAPKATPKNTVSNQNDILYDLSTGSIDTSLFPARSWGRIQKELMYQRPELLQRGDMQGDENLRAQIAAYLGEYRGVDCTADQVVVGAGVEYLLGCLAHLFAGSTAAVENPGYPRARQVLENNGVTNGAAMRISPLGCLLPARDVDSFIDDVALASSPTHKSDLAVAGAVVIAWAISRAIDGESWSAIVNSLPSIARHAQQKRITTFSASLAARLEIALKIVRNADGTESASEQLYQVVGAGTSTIESVPCAIALVELAQTDPNRCAVLCANLGGDTDTIGAMATAICGALHGVNAIDPALKAELDAVNQLDFNRYATALAKYRQQREAI